MMDLTSTYRLQFRNGMTFDRAVALVPYLKRLGISHFYASPIFAATSGSTHGYDVTDHTVIDPAIGGREGFERLCDTLSEAGLGLILDIVPNHMAASLENPWWRSVMEWGKASPYAHHFDIDWHEPLTLPVLGKPFGEALTAGEIGLATDAKAGILGIRYYDQLFPLAPRSYPLALDRIDHPMADAIIAAAHTGSPDDPDAFHTAMNNLLESVGTPSLDESLRAVSRQPGRLETIHRAQPWRLMFWRDARRHLSYRRFFEVTGLVGVRVENNRVFDDVHRLILNLVRSGRVQGLRVDHVDGLADPEAYLKRLRDAVGPGITIHVEKIVEEGELVPSWPIEGTTGYEFIGSMADVFCQPEGKAALDRAFGALAGKPFDIEAERQAAKRAMVEKNFETELSGLVRLAEQALAASGNAPDETSLKEAIIAMMIALPVYRTYGNAAGSSAEDRSIIEEAAGQVGEGGDLSGNAPVERVAGLLLDPGNEEAEAFRTRFQQLSGPIMAKAVEDTLFYRANSLIAVNEVGGDPSRAGMSLDVFHAEMVERLARQPCGLTGTSTHDTKRGEDARARLYTLSEAPDIWATAVERWRSMHRNMVGELTSGLAPDAATEWLLYQALAGVMETDFDIGDASALVRLCERYLAYVEKALREAKRRTDWSTVDQAYEKGVAAYARRLLSPDNKSFLSDFRATLAPFAQAGEINSLAQTVLKLTVPGVPDIYQGSEGADFSLVDPDNRREPDYAGIERRLGEPACLDPLCTLAEQKQRLITTCLHLRKKHPALFARGTYQPLSVSGPKAEHVLAFLRKGADATLFVAVPRFVFGARQAANGSIDPSWFAGTRVGLDHVDSLSSWRCVLNGRRYQSTGEWPAATLFADAPVAILLAEA